MRKYEEWLFGLKVGTRPLITHNGRGAISSFVTSAQYGARWPTVKHIPGRGWYGLRRQAADMAETATNDNRVKDRLGCWQDSETRKSIYQDRETDALRTEAANVRRQLRVGKGLVVNKKATQSDAID
jgi:hypothetical protein